MSIPYVRMMYNIPIKRGMRVECKTGDGWCGGAITSATHLVVVKPDTCPNVRLKYHPTDYDNIRYVEIT